jgi:hypothetical protein
MDMNVGRMLRSTAPLSAVLLCLTAGSAHAISVSYWCGPPPGPPPQGAGNGTGTTSGGNNQNQMPDSDVVCCIPPNATSNPNFWNGYESYSAYLPSGDGRDMNDAICACLQAGGTNLQNTGNECKKLPTATQDVSATPPSPKLILAKQGVWDSNLLEVGVDCGFAEFPGCKVVVIGDTTTDATGKIKVVHQKLILGSPEYGMQCTGDIGKQVGACAVTENLPPKLYDWYVSVYYPNTPCTINGVPQPIGTDCGGGSTGGGSTGGGGTGPMSWLSPSVKTKTLINPSVKGVSAKYAKTSLRAPSSWSASASTWRAGALSAQNDAGNNPVQQVGNNGQRIPVKQVGVWDNFMWSNFGAFTFAVWFGALGAVCQLFWCYLPQMAAPCALTFPDLTPASAAIRGIAKNYFMNAAYSIETTLALFFAFEMMVKTKEVLDTLGQAVLNNMKFGGGVLQNIAQAFSNPTAQFDLAVLAVCLGKYIFAAGAAIITYRYQGGTCINNTLFSRTVPAMLLVVGSILGLNLFLPML